MFTLSWYLSKTVRQASDMRRQVRMLLNEQRDLLKPDVIANLEAGIAAMTAAIRANPGKKALGEAMSSLEKVANANLKPYPAPGVRENVKEILVAITTIMAFTTFFLQLTKIPTGSMQPTLFGITDEDLRDDPNFKLPSFFGRLKDYWVWGISYAYFVAPEDGQMEKIEPLRTIIPFVKKQSFTFAGKTYTDWFPGDSMFGSPEHPAPRAPFERRMYKKGEVVFAAKIVAGDHLLVDRITYNFRRPKRGEIVVFKTRGISGLSQDQLYIKRLVGLPGEKLQIGDDRHLIIDGRRLDASTPNFEFVYNLDHPDPLVDAINNSNLSPLERTRLMGSAHRKPPYRGHVNDKVARTRYGIDGSLAPLFPDQSTVFPIRPDHFMPMGDNTLNSADSRGFGDVANKNLIGKCWFIYWPFTERFGWGYR